MYRLRSPTPAMMTLAIIVLLLLIRFADSDFDQTRPLGNRLSSTEATVLKVLDGDTVEIDDGRRVRLLGIDAPEVAHHDQPGERYGEESAAWLRDQLLHCRIKLLLNHPEKDRYGRTLAWIFLEDGTSISQLALSTGHARLLDTFGLPLEFESDLRMAAAEAQVHRRGLWQRKSSSTKR